jgi:single-strand DNA-binding protein
MAARSVNKWYGIGNLTRDAEVKYTPNGATVASVSIACNNRYKDADGNWQDGVDYINLKVWGKLAEVLGNFGKKGKQIYAEGSFKTDNWQDKETGKKVYNSYVLAREIVLLGGGGESVSRTDDFDQRPPEERKDKGAFVNGHNLLVSDADLPDGFGQSADDPDAIPF